MKWFTKSLRGNQEEMPPAILSIGASLPTTPESNLKDFTPLCPISDRMM